jgi:hypothetical protein
LVDVSVKKLVSPVKKGFLCIPNIVLVFIRTPSDFTSQIYNFI